MYKFDITQYKVWDQIFDQSRKNSDIRKREQIFSEVESQRVRRAKNRIGEHLLFHVRSQINKVD